MNKLKVERSLKMKPLRKMIIPIIAMTLIAGLILNFGGCMNSSPVAPEANSSSSQSGLQFVSLGKGDLSLNKIIQVSALITVKDGGELILKFKPRKKKESVEVKLVLKVFPESISEDTELTLSIDDSLLIANVDMTFGPHGITFSKAALLSIDANRLDLAEVESKKDINLYYYNPDTDQWELVTVKKIKVDLNDGKIKVKDAQIPHFSRYAVAWSN